MQIFAASHLLPISSPPIAGGAIAVADGHIVEVGPLSRLKGLYNCAVTEFPGCVIMPGLVNAHSHLELTHFPSWKLRKGIDYSPRTYVDWVIQVIKIRRGLNHHELALSVKEGARISLESGTTAIGEILTDYSLVPIYSALSFGGRLFFEALGHDLTRCSMLAENINACLSSFSCGPLHPGVSPHAPHTVSSSLLQQVASLAQRSSLPLSIHLSESREEEAFCFDSTGKIAEVLYPFVDWNGYIPAPRRQTATEYLESLGVLSPRTLAVHCVHLNPNDIQILKRRDVKVVLCPRSNDRLNVGIAPAALFKKAGLTLAIGTDSLASNDSLSLIDEMRFALSAFPGIFSPAELITIATMGGAEALGLPDVGALAPGKKADFIVLEPHVQGEDIYTSVIEESDLLEVFVGGTAINTSML